MLMEAGADLSDTLYQSFGSSIISRQFTLGHGTKPAGKRKWSGLDST